MRLTKDEKKPADLIANNCMLDGTTFKNDAEIERIKYLIRHHKYSVHGAVAKSVMKKISQSHPKSYKGKTLPDKCSNPMLPEENLQIVTDKKVLFGRFNSHAFKDIEAADYPGGIISRILAMQDDDLKEVDFVEVSYPEVRIQVVEDIAIKECDLNEVTVKLTSEKGRRVYVSGEYLLQAFSVLQTVKPITFDLPVKNSGELGHLMASNEKGLAIIARRKSNCGE